MSPAIDHDPAPVAFHRNSARNLSLWAAVTAAVLAIPFVAMFYTNEVKWSPFDFAFAGIVIFGLGALYEAAARHARGNGTYRWAAALTLLTLFFTIWFQGAVGIIGDEGEPVGLFFMGVVLAVTATGIATRFRAKAMSIGLYGIAGAQALLAVGCIVASYDQRGSVIALVMAGMWAAAATLFRNAAADEGKVQS